MPITPFHFGPGALIKAVTPTWFCWSAFALANALIDVEPVTLYFLSGEPAHPWLHTPPGALAVAALTATLGRRPCEWILHRWNCWLSQAQRRWLGVDPMIMPVQAWAGALIGALSHLALDALMHADVRPLWPLLADNPWQGAVSLNALHLGCAAAAVAALLIWLFNLLRRPIDA